MHTTASCRCRITSKLQQVCQNPTVAGFNHSLFDAAAALVAATQGDAAVRASLEARLLAAVDMVLQRDVEEFLPYVVQLLAQLLTVAPEPQAQYLDVRPPPSALFGGPVRVGRLLIMLSMCWELLCRSS